MRLRPSGYAVTSPPQDYTLSLDPIVGVAPSVLTGRAVSDDFGSTENSCE